MRALLALASACLLIHARPAAAAAPQLASARSPALAIPSGGNGSSAQPVITPDGRFVLFTSSANNLVSGENNFLRSDVFLYDRLSNTTTLVSVNLTNTGGGNGHSSGDCVSTNGRYVVFESDASDLVANDTNGLTDIFERDLLLGTTVLVSVATNGGSGNGISLYPVMTPDGRYVAFLSLAANLVPGDNNGIEDVFVRDMVNGTTTLASVGAAATGNYQTYLMDTPAITPDGRYVTFFSSAYGLTPGIVNPAYSPPEVFMRDLTMGITVCVSSNLQQYGQYFGSMYPFPSDDGRYVTFQYLGPTNGGYQIPPGIQIFQYDATTQSTNWITSSGLRPGVYTPSLEFGSYPVPHPDFDTFAPRMTPDGRYTVYLNNDNNLHRWDAQTSNDNVVSLDLSTNPATGGQSTTPLISRDGRYVTFLSTATNLVTNSIVAGTHIYQRDLGLSNTTLVDVDPTGSGSVDVTSTALTASTNGQFVAFAAFDCSLTPNDTNLALDVFLRDVVSGTTTRISGPAPGVVSASGNGMSFMNQASLSTNGRWLVFSSAAEDLVPNDGNGLEDVFVRDLQAGTNALVSVGMNGLGGLGGFSGQPLISGDGRYIVFVSGATNLTSGITNFAGNIFERDLQMGTTTAVDLDSSGALFLKSLAPAMSRDGRYVTFQGVTNGGVGTGTFWRDTVGNVTALITNVAALPPSISADGRYVAGSDAASHPYVWDSVTGTNVFSTNVVAGSLALSPTGAKLLYQSSSKISVIAVSNGSTLFTATSSVPIASPAVWSANERFFTFVTVSAISPNDTNNVNDVFLGDLLSGSVTLVSSSITHLGSGNAGSDSPTLSGDGRFTVFRSFATDLAPGIVNPPNVFVFDRLTGSNTLLTAESSPLPIWNSFVEHPGVSADGSTVAFQSTKAALVPASLDLNRNPDIFAAAQSPWPLTDSVGDGIPDAWRAEYFGGDGTTTNSQSCASCDADASGLSNLQDYLAGINPLNPATALRLQLSASVTSNNVTLNWPAAAGRGYTIQYKVHLTDPTWLTPAGTPWVVGNTGNFAIPFSQTGGYYRVIAVY